MDPFREREGPCRTGAMAAAAALGALLMLFAACCGLWRPDRQQVLGRAVEQTRRHLLRPSSFQLREVRYLEVAGGLLLSVEFTAEAQDGRVLPDVDYYRWSRGKDLLAVLLSDYDRARAAERLERAPGSRALPREELDALEEKLPPRKKGRVNGLFPLGSF